MVVAVLERWKGKIHLNKYEFTDRQQMQNFIRMCKESNCLIFGSVTKNNNRTGKVS